jgi:hypothetical protein
VRLPEPAHAFTALHSCGCWRADSCRCIVVVVQPLVHTALP